MEGRKDGRRLSREARKGGICGWEKKAVEMVQQKP